MQKYISHIVVLLIGLALGYFFLGKASNETPPEHTHSEAANKEEIWTCSMDPQIRQNEPGDCSICGMELTLLEETGTTSNPLQLQMTKDATRLANIQTSVIGSQSDKGKGLRLNGKIQIDETRSASIVSHIPGRIEQLFVSFTGENIRKGQKIATIYAPDLITAQKELLEAQKIADSNPRLLAASRKKLQFWRISDTIINKILASGQLQEYFPLYAEHSGIVNNKRISVGDHLSEGEVLFDIQNLNNLWVLFDVYEQDLPGIKVGQTVHFQTASFPGDDFIAKINFINPVVNPKTRVATIRASINNRGNRLKPEMFVQGNLAIAATKKELLLVPKSAILWTGERSVAYVKVPNMSIPTFEYKEVKLGEVIGRSYVILHGLEPGDRVVTHGAFVIDASAQLNNQQSMMNRITKIKGAEEEPLPDYSSSIPKSSKVQLQALVNEYIFVKDALVLTNDQQTSKAITKLLDQLNKVNTNTLQLQEKDYIEPLLLTIKESSEQIPITTKIEAQREHFDIISQAMITIIKVFGNDTETLYIQHCPMAFDNTGADWISKDNFIRNPYFGDKMLKCGTVKDSIY